MNTTRQARRSAQQLFRLCHVDGRLDSARTRNVVGRLAASSRRGTLAILSDLLRLVRLERDERRAIVETATALPEDLRTQVQSNLARTYGDGLETVFALDPGLIGGMRVRVGSDVYDASVRARLAALQARI